MRAPFHFFIPPLKGEGRTAEGGSGRGQAVLNKTLTRRASRAGLPLSGGGNKSDREQAA